MPKYEPILLKNMLQPGYTGSLTEYERGGGYQAIRKVLGKVSPADVTAVVMKSGLRGRGGAGFPTGVKWGFLPKDYQGPRYLCCNADESEPGTFKDRQLIERDPHQLLEGMLLACYAIGAASSYIYIRGEFVLGAKILEQAINDARAAGYVGKNIFGSNTTIDIWVHRGAGAYICGEETALLESLEGKRGVVRARPPYPAQSGLYGRPTIVSNVLTFATIPNILSRGGAWHAALGTEQSRGTMALQLGGRVKHPGLVEVPFGLSLHQVLEQFGGGMAPGSRFKAVQVGGPLGSLFPASQMDIPICYDAFAKAGAVLGHGGIVVYDHETDMVDLARHFMAFTADESCGKCTPCRIGSVRGREILERIQAGSGTIEDLSLLHDLGDTMKVASLCALGGRAPYPVLTAIEHFFAEFRSKLRT